MTPPSKPPAVSEETFEPLTPEQLAEFDRKWKEALERTRPMREAIKRAEERSRNPICECPDFCFYHTRLR